jgi:phosphatidylserine/phosphatidylglycerophosphate/cardiolipin synthase-like enzyme
MPNPDDFFLTAQQTSDDANFLAARRDGVTVTPLIDGIETFREMEKAIATAQSTVHLAAWILNPEVPLQAANEVKQALKVRDVRRPVKNWGDLLSTVAGLGVKVAVLLTDFDPIVQAPLHLMTWRTYAKLQASAKANGGGNMQILPSLHEHLVASLRAFYAATTMLNVRLADKLNEAVTTVGAAAALSQVQFMPRLEGILDFDRATLRFTPIVTATSPAGIRAVSHHQKICIVDRTTGFCGGLDVQTGRLDAKGFHARGWHDTHLKVDGPLAADLDRNFIGRWNAEMADFHAFIATASIPVAKNADQVTAIPMSTTAVPAGTGPGKGQLIRTITQANATSELPTLKRDDILLAYQKAIGLAEKYVYIHGPGVVLA